MKKQIGYKAGSGSSKKPYTAPDSASSKSIANIVYGISEGEIAGFVNGDRSILLDNTPVQSVSGEYNISGVEVDHRLGTNDQTFMPGFPSVVNEIGYSNVEIKSTSPFVHYVNDLNVNAARVRFTWGKIFKQNPDNGDVYGYRIEYAIDVQTDGNGFVEVLRTALDDKTSNGYQRQHRIELPPAEIGWEIRVRRITPNQTSDFVGDKMYLTAVAEIIDTKLRYPNTAIIGLKFDADKFGSIPKADFRLRGKLIKVPTNYNPETRIYSTTGLGTTNGVWDGTFKLAYSNNPAWIFYDLVLSRRYGLGDRIDASMLDKWSLYSIAQHCDVMVPDGLGGVEPRLTCNVYLNNKFEAFELLMQLVSTFQGIIHWEGSSIVCTADRPTDPVYTFTRSNIIGEFNYSGTRARDRHSLFAVAFDDPANNYKTDKEVVSSSKAISEVGVRVKELTAFGCTSRGQAQRIGRRALLKEQEETRMVTFAVGLEGYIPITGKIIEIADPLLAGRAIGGRVSVVSSDNLHITVDRDIESSLEGNKRLVINGDDGIQQSRDIVGIDGRVVTVSAAFVGVSAEHVWAIDSDDLKLMRFRVLSVSQNRSDSGIISFTVSAVQHNPDTQDSSDNSTYIEPPNYSNIDIYTQETVKNFLIDSENTINQGIDITNVVFSWDQAKGAVKYELEWRRDNGTWIKAPLIYSNTYTVENVYHGVYEARIVAINAMDVRSLYVVANPKVINSKFAEPPMLSALSMAGQLFGVVINWSFPAVIAQNALYTKVEISFRADKADAKLLGDFAYPLNRTEVTGLHGNIQVWVRARIIDRNHVEGPWFPWVSAVTEADPEKLLEILNGHIGLEAIDAELAQAIDDNTTGVSDAKALANQAKTAAANAQTTANNAGTAASNAQATATNAANAVAKEVTDRAAAITAEAKARTDGLTKEATDRAAAISQETTDRIAAITKEANDRAAAITQESTDRAAALTAQANTLKADSAAKVKALKDEVDPKIATLQNGITQVTTDYKAGDTAVVGQLNAYKTSNDSAVASVLQKAESAVATGSTNSSAITAINGQITTINGTLSTKLDASVIAGYYTKGQTDAKAAEIAAGKVEEFNASLVIGGVNLINRHDELKGKMVGQSGEIASFTGSSTINGYITVKAGEPITLSKVGEGTDNYFRYAFYNDNDNVILRQASANNLISLTVPANATRFRISYPTTASVQAERGTKATDIAPSSADVQSQLDANANAIQNTNAEVTRVDGRVTAANSATTALSGRVSTVEGAVATKAEAAALTALTTRVTNAEGVNTSQGSAITTLQNTVNHATTGLATKASTSALTATNSEVSRINGVVTGHSNQLTQLTSDITTINGTLATKANASALNDFYTKTQADAKATEIAAGEVSKYDASLVIGGSNLFANSDFSSGTAGWESAGTGASLSIVNDTEGKFKKVAQVTSPSASQGFKSTSTAATALKLEPDNTYTMSGWVRASVPVTLYPAIDGSGISNALPVQADTTWKYFTITKNLTSNNIPRIYGSGEYFVANVKLEKGTKATDWSPSPSDVKSGIDANATAITNTNTEVARVDGRVTTESNRITTLTGRVDTVVGDLATKADASALNSLTTRVVTEEGKSTSQGNAITTLQNTINHATTGLASKASSAALTTVDNKVTAANGRIDTANAATTALTGRVSTVEGELVNKANVSALDNLTTRVTNTESGLTTQANKTTSLEANLDSRINDSSLAYDYDTKNPNDWESHYSGRDLSPHFVQVTDGKLGNRVFRKDTSNPSTNYNYNLAAVPNDRAYRLSMWVRCSSDSTGILGFNYKYTTDASPEFTSAYSSVTSKSITKDGTWQLVTAIADFRASAFNRLRFGFYAGHSGAAGWWEMQGFRVEAVTNAEDVDNTLATATALTTTNSEVSRINGVVVAQGTSITNLQAGLTTANNNIATKADGSALTALTTRVSNAEGVNTSQGSAITTLQNTVNHATTGLASKASSTALTAVDNKVTAANGRIDTTNSNVTALTGRVSTVEGAVATKAEAAAVTALGTRVGTVEGGLESASSNITSLTNSLDASISAIRLVPTQVSIDTTVKTRTDGVIELMDDASTTVPKVIKVKAGSAYNMFAGPHVQLNPNTLYKVSYKVKRLSGTGIFYLAVIPLTQDKANGVNNTNGLLGTTVISSTTYPFSGSSATAPVDVWKEGIYYIKGVASAGAAGLGTLASPRSLPNLAAFLRLGAIVPANTEFAIEYFTVEAADADGLDAANTAATSAAINTTNTEVSRINGVVVAQGTSITNLQSGLTTANNNIATKADGSALSALTTRVSNTETALDTQSTSITNLNSSLATTNTNVTAAQNAANAANTLAGGKGKVLVQSTAPAVADRLTQNLWIDTTGNANTPKRWSGSAWVAVTDKVATDAAAAAAAAQATADTKADATALTSLTTRVTTAEGNITSQGTRVTSLENSVNNATTGLASKASSSALTTLNNQVQHSTTGLSAVNSKVDSLKATVENTTSGLASKASSSALDTLANKVNHSTTGLDAIASKTTVLETDVAKALDVVTISDTRSTNQPPSWYWANYAKRTVNEFKTQTVIGVGSFFGGTYCNLETNIPYSDSSGGHIVQTATSAADPSLYVQRVSISTAAWGVWAQPIKDLRDGLAGKAAASAVESLTTRVATAEGTISSEATKLANLTTTVGGHTTSIATQSSSIDGIQAKHTVKINNNGFVSGYGLISTANNGAVVSAFKVDADAFAVGKSGSGILPFVVTTAGQTISGITYPAAGTWINSAYIANATINTAHIKDAAITTAKIGDLQVDTLKIKDNAVTVPVGVTALDKQSVGVFIPGIHDLDQQITAWEGHVGSLASITINRTGGKCRLDAHVSITQQSDTGLYASWANNTISIEERFLIRAFISVYRGSVLVGRSSIAPSTALGAVGIRYGGSISLVAALDESVTTGNETYTLKFGFGYVGTAGGSTYAGTAGKVNFILSAIRLSVMEMKK